MCVVFWKEREEYVWYLGYLTELINNGAKYKVSQPHNISTGNILRGKTHTIYCLSKLLISDLMVSGPMKKGIEGFCCQMRIQTNSNKQFKRFIVYLIIQEITFDET